MLKLVRRARQRLLHNELFAQGANAMSAILLAFLLVLVAGTELLSWHWLLPIPAAAVAVGIYLTSRRLPSPYHTARIVDHRLGLADTLSTAYYFSHNQDAPSSPGVRETQAERAERMAESADVRQAVPYRWPRTIYAMLALLAATAGLFGLRYGLSRTLDLKPPLASMLGEQFGFEPKKQQAKNNRRSLYNPLEPQPTGDDAMADPNEKSADQDMNDEADTASQDLADQPNTATQKEEEKQADGMMPGNDMDAQAEPQSDPMGEKDGQGQQQGSKSDQAKSGSQQSPNDGQNSLLGKMKDAMQNLLSKMKPQQSNTDQQQQGNQNSQQNGKAQAGGKQQASKDGQKGEKAQQGEAQDGQNAETAENGPDQQGQGQGKTDSQNKQAGSGAGSQEGDKNIKQAAQLAAMGKISEILGKRSATITGEATVEVEATSQQLKTSYAAKNAQHAQSGGEINRDEVPVALQPFVEQYFEQVRKQAPAAPEKK